MLGGELEMPDRIKLKERRVSVARSFVDWSLGTQADLTAELAKITCPALWLTGERDAKFTELRKAAVPHCSTGSTRSFPNVATVCRGSSRMLFKVHV